MKMQSDLHWARRMDATLPHRRTDLVQQELDGEAVLFDTRNGCTHRMNATALGVWLACDGKTSTRAVAGRLTAAYDVSLDQAQIDVEQLVAAMAGAGLLLEEG